MGRSAFIIFLVQIIGAIISFVAIAYLSQFLGAEPLGQFFLFLGIASTLSLITNLGINEATEKRVSESRHESNFLSAALIIKSISLISFLCLILIAQGLITPYNEENAVLLLVLFIFLIDFQEFVIRLLQAQLKLIDSAIVYFLFTSSGYVLSLVLVTQLEHGVKSLAYGFLMAYVLSVTIGITRLKPSLARPTREHLRGLWTFGGTAFIWRIAACSWEWFPTIMAGLLRSHQDVGIYVVAWRVSALAILPANAISAVIFPYISAWSVRSGTRASICLAVRNSIIPAVLLPMGMLSGAVFLARPFLKLVFGEVFAQGGLVLTILLVARIFQAITNVLAHILLGLDKAKQASTASALAAVINVMLGITFGYWQGIHGIALAVTIGFVASCILQFYQLGRLIQLEFPSDELSHVVLSGGALSILMLILTNILPITTFRTLSMAIISGFAVYSCLLIIDSKLRDNLWQLAASVGFIRR